MTKIYNVSIEQPLCRTWEVEADNIEQAIEIARQKYNSEEWVLTSDDIGTDAQIMAEEETEDGTGESTEWDDL